jgi:Prp8 binding protein
MTDSEPAPSRTMVLQGHKGEVYSVDFSPCGRHLASAGFDRSVLVWGVYGDCDNWCELKGHSNAILELHWDKQVDSGLLYTCSADKTLSVWNVHEGKRIRKLTG